MEEKEELSRDPSEAMPLFLPADYSTRETPRKTFRRFLLLLLADRIERK